MKKKGLSISVLFAFSFILSQFVNAQASDPLVFRVGYIHSAQLLEAVPGKIEATAAIKELNRKYKEELVVMQNDYNKKYSDFISDQNILSENIKLRRMQELHELEKNINAFMKVAQEDVESQEQQLIEPLRKKLAKAIEAVGREEHFTCIYDLSNPAVVFVTPQAVDANPLVKKKLAEE
jgi:outer membrane protein